MVTDPTSRFHHTRAISRYSPQATVVVSAVTARPADSTAEIDAPAKVSSSSAGVATKKTRRDSTTGVDSGSRLVRASR